MPPDPTRKNQVSDAVLLARRLHRGQKDKAGMPYHMHLERTAHRLIELFPDVTVGQIQGALLHDAIEDRRATAAQLHAEGIEPEAVRIAERLCRRTELSYLDWIRTIAASGDVDSIRVKLADLLDNADTRRPDFPGRAKMLVEKYIPAVEILAPALGMAAAEVWGTYYPKMPLKGE
jgi:(p)ppGpp synthase/HD superfamily hydrolase